MYLSIKPTQNFCNQFQSFIMSSLAKYLVFISSSLVSLLILFGVFNEAILSITIYDRNLWWYIAVFSGCTVIFKSYIITTDHFPSNPKHFLKESIKFTHYSPSNWNNDYYKIFLEINNFFNLKLINFSKELVSVFLSPYFIIYHIRTKINKICNFIKEHSINDENIGIICDYSANCNKYQDDKKMTDSYKNFIEFYNISNSK